MESKRAGPSFLEPTLRDPAIYAFLSDSKRFRRLLMRSTPPITSPAAKMPQLGLYEMSGRRFSFSSFTSVLRSSTSALRNFVAST